MAGAQTFFTKEKLLAYIGELYEKAGLTSEDAGICADCTVQTNLWGVDSHGVLRTTAYIERILSGAVKARPEIKNISSRTGPIALLDGDAGMGYVVGTRAMDMAIETARQFGLGLVLVRNSNHFGAASLFARRATGCGMLGIATTNVKPNIGMPGARASLTGNNPLALAAPLPGPFPFSLDISMSSVAGGKILLAQKKGEKIPTTWALDPDGNETDDPFKAFAGILLPMGMHKGLGLSLFIDIITGVLSGGPFLKNLKSMYGQKDESSETSHLFVAIDPAAFLPEGEFESRMTSWTEMIASTPMVDPAAHQIVPGEIEYACEKQRTENGIPLPEELVKDLVRLGQKLGTTGSLD